MSSIYLPSCVSRAVAPASVGASVFFRPLVIREFLSGLPEGEFLAVSGLREFLGSGEACEFLERSIVREFLEGEPCREFLDRKGCREFLDESPPREFFRSRSGREFSELSDFLLDAGAPFPRVAQPPVVSEVLAELCHVIIDDAVAPVREPRYVPEVHIEDGEREVMEAGTGGHEFRGAPALEKVGAAARLAHEPRQCLHPVCLPYFHAAKIRIFRTSARNAVNF